MAVTRRPCWRDAKLCVPNRPRVQAQATAAARLPPLLRYVRSLLCWEGARLLSAGLSRAEFFAQTTQRCSSRMGWDTTWRLLTSDRRVRGPLASRGDSC